MANVGKHPGLVIDSQVHVWDLVRDPAKQHRDEPLRGEELIQLMDAAEVDRAILIPPSFAGDRNEECLRSARLFPRHFGVMGNLPLDRRDAFELIPSWRSQPGMLGIRISFHLELHRRLLLDGELETMWALAAAHEVPIMVYPVGGVLSHLRPIAERHPRLRITIDHFGAPAVRERRALDEAAADVTRLADLPNVGVKASSLPYYSQTWFPFPDVHDAVCRVLSAFGAERVFWGTDLTRLRCSYADAVRMLDHIACLDPQTKRAVKGDSLRRWLSWD